MNIRILLVAGSALALTACASLPQSAPPAVATPASLGADARTGVWPARDWWRAFGSSELDRLVLEAQTSSTDIAAAAARVVQAEAQTRVAGSALFPALDLGGDTARSGRGGGLGSNASFGLSGGASYELDFWGRNRADLASARQSLLASIYDQETVALTTTANVAQNYFAILSLRDRRAIAELNIANASRVLDLIEARVESGAATPLEVAQQRSFLAGQRAQVPVLEQQEIETRAVLATLLGRPSQGLTVAGRNLQAVRTPRVQAGLPAELLQRRPDIKRAEAQLAAADADVFAARAAFFPTIRLTGSSGVSSAALGTLFEGGNFAWNIAAGLTQPIFQGGRLTGLFDASRGRQQELVETYRGAVVSAFSDVDVALGAIRNVARREAQLAIQVREAQTAFELAEARYRAGAEDLVTILDAQRTLYSAQDALSQVRLARLQAIVDLYRALGGGWSAATAI